MRDATVGERVSLFLSRNPIMSYSTCPIRYNIRTNTITVDSVNLLTGVN